MQIFWLIVVLQIESKGLIHINVWQKSLQYCKVISLQLIKINEKQQQQQIESKGYQIWIWRKYDIWIQKRWERHVLGEYSNSCLFSSVQLLSHVQLFETPWTAACQASLSITNSQSLLKFMSIESVMPSNHFILCCPLLLLPSIFPSIRVFSNESILHIKWPKYWSLFQHQSFQWIFRTDFL